MSTWKADPDDLISTGQILTSLANEDGRQAIHDQLGQTR